MIDTQIQQLLRFYYNIYFLNPFSLWANPGNHVILSLHAQECPRWQHSELLGLSELASASLVAGTTGSHYYIKHVESLKFTLVISTLLSFSLQAYIPETK
jgi:hypothetical protein